MPEWEAPEDRFLRVRLQNIDELRRKRRIKEMARAYLPNLSKSPNYPVLKAVPEDEDALIEEGQELSRAAKRCVSKMGRATP
jgi:hypothetical protein